MRLAKALDEKAAAAGKEGAEKEKVALVFRATGGMRGLSPPEEKRAYDIMTQPHDLPLSHVLYIHNN